MSIYSKNLVGQPEKIFVAPNIAFTAQTTFAAFVNSAAVADGEIGVFLDTGAVKTTALTAGQQFWVAQKRDGQVYKTPVIQWDRLISKVRTAYSAPVAKIVSIGYSSTNTTATIAFNQTTAGPTNTLSFGIVVRDTTPGNQPFPVQEGYAYSASATTDAYTMLAQIASGINFDVNYENVAPDPFVYAEIQQNGTTAAITVAATLAVTNRGQQVVFNATPTGAPVVGGYIGIGGTGNLGVMYKITAIAADNVTYTLDRPYAGASNAALAIANVVNITGYTSGTTLLGLRITGVGAINGQFNNPTFIVAGNYGLIAAPVVTTTQWLLGAGYGANIKQIEVEEFIFDGVGSTVNAAFQADYGYPTGYASTTLTYDQIFLNFAPFIFPAANALDGTAPAVERLHIATVVGTTSGSVLQTVFGL